MSNWREYKNFVERYNERYSNSKIDYINVKEKTKKLTWRDIATDLIRQIEAYKRLRKNMHEYELEQAEESRRRAAEITEENRRQKIRQEKYDNKSTPIEFVQSNIFSEPKVKIEPIYQLEDVQLFENQELLNECIKKIKSADVEKDGLCIYFNNSDCKFKYLKSIIRDKLNSTSLDGLYLQVSFKTYDGQDRYQTYSLMNETAKQIINALLSDQDHQSGEDLEYEFNVDEPSNLIEVSGMNKDELESSISIKQITAIRIINKNNANKECKNKIYTDNGGSFYMYKINEKFISNVDLVKKLERYQIFTSLDNKAFDENCLVYAMRQTGLFSESILNNMRTTCYTRYISKKQLTQFGKLYNIKFKVIKYVPDKNSWDDITHGQNTYFGSDKENAIKINLALIEKHYILNEYVEGINKYYLDHYDEINEACKDKSNLWKMHVYAMRNIKGKQVYEINIKKAHMKSYDLVNFMTSDHISWTFDDLCHLKTNLYEFNSTEIKDLNNYCDRDFKQVKQVQKITKNVDKSSKVSKVYFADTETDTSGTNHVAFCIAYAEQDELDSNFNIISENKDIKFEFGRNCLSNFLDKIEDHALVYFHNLAYDIRQFNQFDIIDQHDKNTKVMDGKIKYKGKTIYFKDSLSIVSMKLADFPTSFNLDCGIKEMFPYNYYTFENFEKLDCKGIISEAGKQELKHNWNQQQFEDNLNKLNIVEGDKFDMIEYVKFYCCQDVRILKQGFQKFRKMCLESLKIDVNQVLTAPSLASQYFTREIYEKIPDYYFYGGIVRSFIQKAVYGGRCMTRLNKRWSVNEELADFDAVSLYPSAMKRLYCVKGKPEVLKPEELNIEYLLNNTCSEDEQPGSKSLSAYVVEIKITAINKHLAFPCIVYKDTTTNTNRNDDISAIGRTAVVDNITLEDWIKYNGLECEVLRGYKWCGEKSFLIRDVIQNLHLLRCEYKKTHNPLQLVIKLIMNSAYGKMIQKPITSKTVFKKYQTKKFDKKTKQYVDDYPLNKFLIKNSAKIIKYTQVNKNLYAIKVGQQIDDFYTNTLLGVQILSMSKRIMNEVMCTAEDLNINIYYQDTDSMHIQKSRLNDLSNEYFKRFGRELIGKNLGQFHNDFDEVADGYAYQSIFVGKKMYVDLLKNDKDETGVHYRMKGVNLDCVKLYAEEHNCEIFDIYNKLFNGETLTFDLLKAKPCFKMNDNQTVTNQLNFERSIKATSN